jgi:hypothetical protein
MASILKLAASLLLMARLGDVDGDSGRRANRSAIVATRVSCPAAKP